MSSWYEMKMRWKGLAGSILKQSVREMITSLSVNNNTVYCLWQLKAGLTHQNNEHNIKTHTQHNANNFSYQRINTNLLPREKWLEKPLLLLGVPAVSSRHGGRHFGKRTERGRRKWKNCLRRTVRSVFIDTPSNQVVRRWLGCCLRSYDYTTH